jgi:hypothetical protein
MSLLHERPVLHGLLGSIGACTLTGLVNIAFSGWAADIGWADAFVMGLFMVPFGWLYFWLLLRQQRTLINESQHSDSQPPVGRNFEHNQGES